MRDERDTAEKASAPATAAAGALAGAAAGLATITLGPIGAGIGAIVGGLAGGAIGATAAAGPRWSSSEDEHYRALWENAPHAADASYERARPAYQFGHIAAQLPEYAGRDFHAVEPTLRAEWERDMQAQYGEWSAARTFVCDAYGHARAEGLGVRRDASVIGTGGSAVDPVELERAQAGLASRADTPEGDEPLFPTDLTATTATIDDLERANLGERPTTDANSAHHERADFR